MIEIFHFIPTLNCDSGITSLLMTFYRKINKNKFRFNFIYFLDSDSNNFENEIVRLGGNCYKISNPRNFFAFRKDLKEIFDNCKNKNIIFHNHLINFTVLINDIVKKYFLNNIIIHNHQTKYSDRFISSIRNRILCIPLKFYDYNFFACSDEAGRKIFGNKIKYFVLNNGIDVFKYKFDLKKREIYRNELGFSKNDIVIGHVGRFEYAKNHIFMIDVFEQLVLKNPNYKLLFIGNGRLKNDIIQIVKKKNLSDNVIFLNARSDISELLSSMDSFIFPSIFEGLGLAAVEAQASGLPILISDGVPRITGIINYSFLSLNDGVDKWCDEMNRLLNEHNINNRFISNDFVANSIFNIDQNVKILEQKYIDILLNR